MSIATEIGRIKQATADIRSKYVELGISQSADKIDDLAIASGQIENKGAVSATVTEGSTYTIPKGYHNGSGTVTGLPPAGDAVVETWETPDMTSENTPSPYSVTSEDTAEGECPWMAFDGNLTTAWRSAFHRTTFDDPNSPLDRESISAVFNWGSPIKVKGVRFRVKATNHPATVQVLYDNDGEFIDALDGVQDFVASGSPWTTFLFSEPHTSDKFKFVFTPIVDEIHSKFNVDIYEIEFLTEETVTKYGLQAKVITPITDQKNVTPDQGYYGLSSVTVNPIPTNYADVSTVTATPEDVLSGESFVDKDGELQYGEIPDNSAIDVEIDGVTTESVDIDPGYYNEITVSLDDTIEQMLAEI